MNLTRIDPPGIYGDFNGLQYYSGGSGWNLWPGWACFHDNENGWDPIQISTNDASHMQVNTVSQDNVSCGSQ